MRFSRLPPNSSVRWLASGERNWGKSQPWAAWMSTVSKPAPYQYSAASAKASATSSISSRVMASTWPYMLSISSGPMGLRTLNSCRALRPPWVSSTLLTAPCSRMAALISENMARFSLDMTVPGVWQPPSQTGTSPRVTMPAPPRALASR